MTVAVTAPAGSGIRLRWLGSTLGLLVAATWATTCAAAERSPDAGRQTYALELVGARSELGNTPDRGQFGTGAMIDGIRDGSFRSRAEADTSAAAGLRIDLQRGRIVAGLTAHWHFPVDWDVAALTPGIQTITNTFTNVERNVVLARLGYRWPVSSRWSMVAAASAGAVRQRLDVVYTERAVPGVRPEQRTTDRSQVTETAWALELGMHRQLGRRRELGLIYRYLDSGDLSVSARPDNAARLTTSLHDHLLILSLGWTRR